MTQVLSQLGFWLVLNLVFTFSVSGVSIGGHIGGLVGGAIAGADRLAGERRGSARMVGAELAAIVALAIGRVRRLDRRRQLEAGATLTAGGPPRAGRDAGCDSGQGGHRRRSKWSRCWTQVGVEDRGEQLDPVGESRPGPREACGCVDRVDGCGPERAEPLAVRRCLGQRLLAVEAAGHDDDGVGSGRRDLLPGDDARALARPRRGHRCHRPRRSSPAPSGRPRRRGRATRARRPGVARARRRGLARRRSSPSSRSLAGDPVRRAARRLPEPLGVGEHLAEGRGVEREHSRAARQSRRDGDDVVVGDRAHRADGLGDDQIDVELRQPLLVELVERLAALGPLAYGGVDRGGVEARGDDAAGQRR